MCRLSGIVPSFPHVLRHVQPTSKEFERGMFLEGQYCWKQNALYPPNSAQAGIFLCSNFAHDKLAVLLCLLAATSLPFEFLNGPVTHWIAGRHAMGWRQSSSVGCWCWLGVPTDLDGVRLAIRVGVGILLREGRTDRLFPAPRNFSFVPTKLLGEGIGRWRLSADFSDQPPDSNFVPRWKLARPGFNCQSRPTSFTSDHARPGYDRMTSLLRQTFICLLVSTGKLISFLPKNETIFGGRSKLVFSQ